MDGQLTAGGFLTIEIDAQQIGGWQGLHRLDADLLIAGSVVDSLSFSVEDNLLSVGRQDAYAGTGAVASGTYLSVRGSAVVVTTGGAHLSFRIRASVARTIPAGSRFRLSATDDVGQRATILRSPNANQESGGLTWGTVATAVAVALLAGGLIGNLFASKRRPPPRLSVYGAIQHRIDLERSPAREDTG